MTSCLWTCLGTKNYSLGTKNYSLGTKNYSLGTKNYSLGTKNYSLGTKNYSLGTKNYSTTSICKLLFLLVGPTRKIHRISSNFTEFFKNVFLKLNAVKRTI